MTPYPVRTRTWFLGLACLVGLTLTLVRVAAAPAPAVPQTFVVDPAQSRAVINVGKAGLFAFAAGHTHEVVAPDLRGAIELEAGDLTRSTVRLEIDARKLNVTGKGEPAKDVPEVQRIMLSDKVLDVERHPTIVFQSTRVAVTKRTATAIDLTVSGNVTLRAITKPITVAVSVDLGADILTARGRFELKQTDHGISPISVAGVVKVKNELDISFTVVARAQASTQRGS